MSSDENTRTVKLGDALFIARGGELYDSEGQLLPLRPKSARMLAFLLGEPGRIFSKEEIATAVWPDVTASDESISQCVTEIRKVLNDHDHEFIRTFPKRGYSFEAEFPTVRDSTAPRYLPGILTAAVLAVVVTAVFLKSTDSDEPLNTELPDSGQVRNLVAVLPFENLNSAGNAAYLTLGLAEDLIVQMSDLSAVKVLPSVRSFAVSNKVNTPLDVAKDLDVRYLVYGRIHHGENLLQVAIQLIDGIEGTIVWAGEYEVAHDELLTYQQTVLGNLTKAMSVALSERDERLIEAPTTSSGQAFEEILKGRVAASEFSIHGNLLAEKHFREAVRLDPDYAHAYAELAAVYAIRFENDWSVLVDADEEKAMYFAQKAIELDPQLWLAQYAIGRIYSVVRDSDLEAAKKHLRIAMSLKPDIDDARVYFAAVTIFGGQAAEALAIIDSVLATHPEPPHWYFLTQGHALFHLDRHEEAAIALKQCLAQMPTSPYCLRLQIANYGLMGQRDDAEWAIEEYAMLGLEARIDVMLRLLLDKHPDHIERLRKGFSAAGLE